MSTDHIRQLETGERTVWISPKAGGAAPFDAVTAARHIADAEQLWSRFAPALAELFETPDGCGRVQSPLLKYPRPIIGGKPVYVKADHALPITATVKARGGVFALLRIVELIAKEAGLIADTGSYVTLTSAQARAILSAHTVVVASTGNLGFSIGLVARAFGMKAEIHMSGCAQTWKKQRLHNMGVTVIEYSGDYTSTVAAARLSVAARENTWFVDDENSWDLFMGYTGAANELENQLNRNGVHVSSERPLVVYLPCGVGGAPGGITYGLKTIYRSDVICVFVEPIQAACMMLALVSRAQEPPSVYDIGLSGLTDADGLAVSRASALVLEHVGSEIDAAVAIPDGDMLDWLRRTWGEATLKLEPSAAAGFAALQPFLDAVASCPAGPDTGKPWSNIDNATHVVWTTGGNLVPEEVHRRYLDHAEPDEM